MVKVQTMALLIVAVSGCVLVKATLVKGDDSLIPSGCNLDLCTCTKGPPMCARNLSGIYMQYPDCFKHCFRSCCQPNEEPFEVRPGRCTAAVYALVVTEPFKGDVGLVQACPSIYLAAIDATNP